MDFKTFDLATSSGTKRSLTDQGYLLIQDCKLAKAGVFDYLAVKFQPRAFNDRAPTDIIRVYRSIQTIEDAAAGFSGAPITDDHPPEMLGLKNTKLFQKGHINGEVRVVDGVMLGDLIITDKRTIDNIQSGKDELSNGYFSQYSFEAGIAPDGQAFDCEQTHFRANHVAIVAKGRNGAECRISDAIDKPPKEVKPMAIVTIKGVSYEASEQVVQAVGILQTNLDTAEKSLKEFDNVDARINSAVKTKVDEMQAVIDTQKTDIETLKKDVPTVATLDKMAAERADLLTRAKAISPKLDFAGKTNDEICAAVVLTACDDLKDLEGRSAIYIQGRFDGLKAPNVDKKTLDKALGDSLNNNDDTIDQVALARTKASERHNTAWKKGE